MLGTICAVLGRRISQSSDDANREMSPSLTRATPGQLCVVASIDVMQMLRVPQICNETKMRHVLGEIVSSPTEFMMFRSSHRLGRINPNPVEL